MKTKISKQPIRSAGITAAVMVATLVVILSASGAPTSENSALSKNSVDVTAAHGPRNAFDLDHLNINQAELKIKLSRDAADTADEARTVIAQSASVIDVTALSSKVHALGTVASLSSIEIAVLIDDTKIVSVNTSNAAKVEVSRQAVVAAQEASAKEASIEANRDPDAARALAAQIAASGYGWGSGQFSCLDRLWSKESGWRYNARNSSGGATGIPQALPGSKMASFGADYLTNPETQIRWGLDYIKRSYGSPCGAWNHSVSVNWY
jgi:hypothetical protein